MAKLPTHVCTNCSYRGKPKRVKGGSLKLEIILWICGIIPGIIYTIYCRRIGADFCPSCKQQTMISIKGRQGQMLSGA